MSLNMTKYKAMHITLYNLQIKYFLQINALDRSTLEKDLVAAITKSILLSNRFIEVEEKVYRILGYIEMQFSHRNNKFVLNLYNFLIQP